MANDLNPKTIGCSAGKTILVDPNNFDGHSSSSNISVPLEDLSIYVQLETTKRARTILQTGGQTNTKGFKVNFIEGTSDNTTGNQRVLTTRYTDLTTDFSDPSDGETLGITSIDIDFNTSYAPLVVINFVDVRGTSIFQNEGQLMSSKFSTLFQIPYPIFTLTIKGYYGMPVKYDLHMTKFNAKFNSKTGNFEITANFVGYTYAFLSDMLIGYLRAIPHTAVGSETFKDYAKARPYILKIDDLIQAISTIDSTLSKLKAEDSEVQSYTNINEKLENYDNFYFVINTFGNSVGHIKDQNEYKFIILRNDFTATDTLNSHIDTYNTSMKKEVDDFNASSIKIDIDSVSSSNFKIYQNVSYDILNSEDQKVIDTWPQSLKTDTLRREQLISYFSKVGRTDVVTIYDLTDVYDSLSVKKTELQKTVESEELKIGEKVRLQIKTLLKGLDPTIRNIVEIFTASVEVFMESLFKVSETALSSAKREAQLKKLVNKNALDSISKLDYLSDSTSNIGKNSSSGEQEKIFYPWPEYRDKSDTEKTFVETYLGKLGVLDTPSDVTELNFIDDLLNGFITSQKLASNAEIQEEKNKSTWYPVNPLDTKIFFQNYPYTRINNTNLNEIVANSVIRAMIFMGISNEILTPEEIEQFASVEADMIFEDTDDKIKANLTNLTLQNFKDAFAKYKANVSTSIIKHIDKVENVSDAGYEYQYMFDNFTMKLFPFSHGDNNSLDFSLEPNTTKTLEYFNTDKTNNIFLTNYSTTNVFVGKSFSDYQDIVESNNFSGQQLFKKVEDGSMFVKILSPNFVNGFVQPFKTPITTNPIAHNYSILTTKSQVEIKELTLKKENGSYGIDFGQFSGSFGVPEFYKAVFPIPELGESAPYRIGFFNGVYQNIGENILLKNQGYSRRTKTTKIDLSNSKVPIFNGNDFAFDEDYASEDYFPRNNFGNPLMLKKIIDNDVSEISFPYLLYKNADDNYINIFTSRLYYKQKTNLAKAFLFLHSLPLAGLTTSNADSNRVNYHGGVLGNKFVLNTLGHRAGFVSIPRVWAAFIGGLLWRNDISEPIYDSLSNAQIGGGSGQVDPINFYEISGYDEDNQAIYDYYFISNNELGADPVIPNRYQYLSNGEFNLNLINSLTVNPYIAIEEVMLQLPEQVKNEFKTIFFQFAENDLNNAPFEVLKEKVELIDGTNQGSTWDSKWTSLKNNTEYDDDDEITYLKTSYIKSAYTKTYGQNKKAIDNYVAMGMYVSSDDLVYESKYDFFAEFKDGSDVFFDLNYILSEELILINNSYRIWSDKLVVNDGDSYNNAYENIKVNEQDFDNYFKKVIEKLQPAQSTVNNTKKNIEQSIFGTDNEEVIKFQLYRTCKNIYDKWIGGTSSIENIIFKNGPNYRNSIDAEIAKYRAKNYSASDVKVSSDPKFIDSFRFVNRSFRDIGDKLYVNPKEVADNAKFNPNNSFYDIVTNMLSQNYFDFIALPNYINYTDLNELGKMFEPINNQEEFSSGATGPSFVCVYAGQTSKHLDFNDSEYPNDGIDFICGDKTFPPQNAPDFSNEMNQHENNVAVFAVNFSQQNQNIFKDITLDQSEFSETAESLKITDEISSKLGENRATFGGQNMYNVYSVRSYKTEVEMMGNAMVQPMMYFQLNNIPMFHGAYMITHVKHSLKPNNMSTVFTGVRIRNIETPLLSVSELYMPLLNSIQLANNSVSTSTSSFDSEMFVVPDSAVANLFEDPFENNKTVVVRSIPKQSRTIDNTTRPHLGTDFDVAQSTNLKAIYGGTIEFVRYDAKGYGLYVVINHGKINNIVYKSVYGHVSELDAGLFGTMTQDMINNILKGYNPKITVQKGKIFGKSGGKQGAAYLDTANKKYDTAGNSTGAHVHFELRIGDTDKYWHDLKPVFCVPYLPMSAYATYPNGQTPPVLNSSNGVVNGSSADYWSLVALCTLENSTDQGRADVAQSVYNRFASKKYSNGNSIKGLIISPGQYQPVSAAVAEFNACNTKELAILAVMKAKGWDNATAANEINKTVSALNNQTLVNSSKSFIGGRTDFYSTSIQNVEPYKSHLANGKNKNVTRDNQIFGWFVGPGAIAYGDTNPSAASKPDFNNVA